MRLRLHAEGSLGKSHNSYIADENLWEKLRGGNIGDCNKGNHAN